MTYQRKMHVLMTLALVGCFAVNFVIWKLANMFGVIGDPLVAFPLFLLGFGAIFLFVMPYWKRLDDVQKLGQLNSWYWGGMAGAIIMLAWLVAMDLHRSAFGKGAGFMLLAQVIGYAVAWVIWGVRGRGAAE